jgi:hypothetical protein
MTVGRTEFLIDEFAPSADDFERLEADDVDGAGY